MNNQLLEYIARINKAVDYIEKNLNKDLSLEKIAKSAAFSKFHFHRIFHSIMGEPLNQYILRLRIEKAACMLTSTEFSVTEIAYKCGFSNSSTFARAFKNRLNQTPSHWRNHNSKLDNKLQISKNCIILSKIWKEYNIFSYYIDSLTKNQIWRIKTMNQNVKIEVKQLPKTTVAYVRHIGPYKGDTELFGRLFGKVMNWAGSRNLINFPKTKLITIYHDDPNITDENNLRISVCVTVPDDTETDGDIGKMVIQKGNYAIGDFEISVNEYEDAWHTMCGKWLPQSGYQFDDRPCFEICLNNPEEHPQNKHIIQICIPVKPL